MELDIVAIGIALLAFVPLVLLSEWMGKVFGEFTRKTLRWSLLMAGLMVILALLRMPGWVITTFMLAGGLAVVRYSLLPALRRNEHPPSE